MKRDMELVRSILLEVESCTGLPQSIPKIEIADHEGVAIDHHINILRDAALVDWEAADETAGMERREFRGLRLTWQGHEFLDNARNEGVWRRVKDMLADSDIKSASFSIWTTLLSDQLKRNLGMGEW